ncbi:hypothetical protein B0I37DRAFT_366990 [Chaetomium sp. MPI-CAGE-AT-0009]|nr:hypothetical protein B0I37DRAFT_366990 [Chaetomium sp. MPI-CAGE-AT-0009]
MKLAGITTVLAALSMPAPILAAVGGPCSGIWNDGACICLDHNICANTYGGTPEQGQAIPLGWPCPDDAANVWGCYIDNNCPGYGADTACRWRDGCPGAVLSDPVCPGGDDFVCCQGGV